MYIIHRVYCSIIVLISGCITLRKGEHPWNFICHCFKRKIFIQYSVTKDIISIHQRK